MRHAELTNLVGRQWDAVYRLAFRLTNRHDAAEDLTQETFLRATESAERFAAGTNERAWLMRIATNIFLDARRREKTARIEAFAGEVADDHNPAAEVDNRDAAAALRSAIARLPETPRTVFVLRIEQDLDFREIGRMLGFSEQTARWHMLQARRELLAAMGDRL